MASPTKMKTQTVQVSDLSSLPAFLFPINLKSLIDDVFIVLSSKEREVIKRRFSINGDKRHTLEFIGKHFKVTRERIRQIEKAGLIKLKRVIPTTPLHSIGQLAEKIVMEHGGLMLETKFFEKLLKMMNSTNPSDIHFVHLVLSIDSDLIRHRKGFLNRTYWRSVQVSNELIVQALNAAVLHLEKNKDVVSVDELTNHLHQKFSSEEFESSLDGAFFKSILDVDVRIFPNNHGYGLVSWRHINPRSIRDKAHLALKQSGEPLHFTQISERINKIGTVVQGKSDPPYPAVKLKKVTVEAIHNELIRSAQFVLVGRGIYALKEWGYKRGTVADIISLLLKKKKSMTKQEIVEGVLKERIVKKGTISLNLQKYPQFERIGRAVYRLNEKKALREE